MMYEEFRVPDDEELEATLGTSPEQGDEVGVRHLRLASGDGCQVLVTTDALGRSVSLKVLQDGGETMSLFREGAIEFIASDRAPEMVLKFRTADTSGRLELTLNPRLLVSESTLLS